jgi:hypothetical protein
MYNTQNHWDLDFAHYPVLWTKLKTPLILKGLIFNSSGLEDGIQIQVYHKMKIIFPQKINLIA